jgi:CheY-like chemotaxis protein
MRTGSAKHLLVVDDEAGLVRTFKLLLERAGYRVTTASNGQEALDVIRREPIDLAIVDLFMPVLDGLETVQEITRSAPTVKKITISGWYPDSDDDLLAATLDLHVHCRLLKPIAPKALLAAVHDALAEK